MLRLLVSALLCVGALQGGLLRGESLAGVDSSSHVPTSRVERAAWVPAGAVVTLTAECGDSWTFAADASTLLESGFYGLGTATADKENCGGHWTSGGVVIEIAIPKKMGETVDEWLDRCKLAVEKAKVQFPPEP